MKNTFKVLAAISIFGLFIPTFAYAKPGDNKNNKSYDSSHSRSSYGDRRTSSNESRGPRPKVFGNDNLNRFRRFKGLNDIDYARLQNAISALHDSKFEKADVTFDRLTNRYSGREVSPNLMAFLTYNKAIAQLGLNNDKEAIKYFRQVADLDPNSFVREKDAGIYEAYTALGIVYASSGQFEDVKYTLDILKQKSNTCLETCPSHDRINTAVSRLEAMISNAKL